MHTLLGVLVFGNNMPERPWVKTMVGKSVFEDITNRNKKVANKKSLINELFFMMEDDTQ